MKKEKGITLIALIITIIVMLILVAVTVSIAVGAGVFKNARKSKIETLKAMEKEELMVTTMSEYIFNVNNVDSEESENNSIDAERLETAIAALETNYIKDNDKTTSSKLVYLAPSGTLWEINLKTAKVSEYEETSQDPEEPVQDPEEPVANTDGGWVFNSNTNKYEKGTTSYALGDKIDNDDVLEALGIQTGGTYEDKWQVIGLTSTNHLKLLSTKSVATVTLGYDDEVANEPKTAEYYASMTKDEKLERDIASYIGMEDTLDGAAQTATGISSAASIRLKEIYDILGEENITNIYEEQNANYRYRYYYDTSGKVFSSSSTDGGINWTDGTTTSADRQFFVNKYNEKVVIDSDNDEAEIEIEDNAFGCEFTDPQTEALGEIFESDTWLANHFVLGGPAQTQFKGLYYKTSGAIITLFNFFGSKGTKVTTGVGGSKTYGVVAVVCI